MKHSTDNHCDAALYKRMIDIDNYTDKRIKI